jgi:Zn-dependent M28 family amino/carboxypeptidase
VVFVGFTGEEYGLLGSEYFADHPVVPLAQIAGGFNMDGMAVNGRTRDVTVVGYGASELEDYLAAGAAEQGRVLAPEPTPEKGSYYRSDHFMLARKGVPMLYARAGIDSGTACSSKTDPTFHTTVSPSMSSIPTGTLSDPGLYFDVGLSRWSKASEQRPGNDLQSATRAARRRSPQ